MNRAAAASPLTRSRDERSTETVLGQTGLARRTRRTAAKPLKTLERVKGIEPSSSAWKAVALPLSYTRIGTSEAGRQTVQRSLVRRRSCVAGSWLVGEVGLEPTKA